MFLNHFSQRSRVKGHLQIYHAYVNTSPSEPGEPAVETPGEEQGDWEFINGSTTALEELPAQVSTKRKIRTPTY